MNEEVTVVLKLHRKYISNGVTIGYLSVGDYYLCETVERCPHTLPPGIYTIVPSGGHWYSMQWDVVDGVPVWFKFSCNSKCRIRTLSTPRYVFDIEKIMPEEEGIIDLGYLFGMFSNNKWWRRDPDEISCAFVKLAPRGVRADMLKYKLQIL